MLARAGLLDGLAVTTFPSDQDRFAAMFPDLDLKRGVSFVHDGNSLTSEGSAKSFDVAMYLADLPTARPRSCHGLSWAVAPIAQPLAAPGRHTASVQRHDVGPPADLSVSRTLTQRAAAVH